MTKNQIKQSKKVANYIKRNISSKRYQFGDKLPTIKSLCEKTNSSFYEVKYGLQLLLINGIIQRQTSQSYIIISNNKPKTTKELIQQIDSNIIASKLLATGGKFDTKYNVVLKQNEKKVLLFFPFKNKKVVLNKLDIYNFIYSPKLLNNNMTSIINDYIHIIKKHKSYLNYGSKKYV